MPLPGIDYRISLLQLLLTTCLYRKTCFFLRAAHPVHMAFLPRAEVTGGDLQEARRSVQHDLVAGVRV